MEQNDPKEPRKKKREPPDKRTNDPTRDYEQLVEEALLGVLGQEPKP